MVNSRASGYWTKVVTKKVSQSKTTDTSNAADTELAISLPVGTYLIEARIIIDATANSDAKFTIGFTGTTDDSRGFVDSGAAGLNTWGTDVNVVTSAWPLSKFIQGFAIVTVTGTISLNWAQNTSHADATIIVAGSTLAIKKL